MPLLLLLVLCASLPGFGAPGFQITTLSNRPDKISGGDALVRIEIPETSPITGLSVRRNGQDITSSFRADTAQRTLTGLVRGLRQGQNMLEVFTGPGATPAAQLSVINYPATGPIFSGPQEQPFLCQTQSFRLPDGTPLGAPIDADCSVRTVTTYVYKAEGGVIKPLPAGSPRPADALWTTTTNGQRVPYIVRMETGTLNRSIYQTAILHDPTSDAVAGPLAPPRAWNRRLLYTFGGGCTGGWFRQGAGFNSILNDDIVGRGYAEAAATLNVFGNNCQDVVAAETMMMVKERFVESYGVPLFTFGRGGSGGSYQQIQIADGYPGLLDGIIPSSTFPDVLATTQFLVDAQLLDNYFNSDGRSLTEDQKRAIAGVGTLKNIYGPSSGAGRINPTVFCPPELPQELRYHPLLHRAGARCDIFDHTVNVYGRDPATGFARRAIDNTGVQYGLDALNSGVITPAQFLDLNEKIGGYDNDGNPVAARATADPQALRAAYQTGRVTYGGNGLSRVPIIDFRGYTDLLENGDVHQKYHSFSFRERLRAANGSVTNTVMLVTNRHAPKVQAYAIAKMDEWLTNLSRDTSGAPTPDRILRAKPADLADSCFPTDDVRIAEPQTFTGGECNKQFPAFSSPRLSAGGPLAGNVLKCQLKPVQMGEYAVKFNEAERTRLRTLFPGGVCDWKKPGVEQQRPVGVWLQY